MADASEHTQDHLHESLSSNRQLLVSQRQSDSPERPVEASNSRAPSQSMGVGDSPPAIHSGNHKSDDSSTNDYDNNAAAKPAPGRERRASIDSSQQCGKRPQSTHEFRCRSTKSHGYEDLEDLCLSETDAKRLEAMQAKNGKINQRIHIVPRDAPPHMQMMVLLYQWAAWAHDIGDQEKRRRLLKWVNGRTTEFMMRGGRLPGYQLGELLSIAGVDPKELYGCSRDLTSPEEDITNVDRGSSITAGSQESPVQALEAPVEMRHREPGPYGDETALDLAQKPISVDEPQQFRRGNDGKAQDKHELASELRSTPMVSSPPSHENPDSDHDRSVSTPPEAVALSSIVASENKMKREAGSYVLETGQDSKRRRVESEHRSGGQSSPQNGSESEHRGAQRPSECTLPSTESARNDYRQTYFKAKLNVLLKQINKSKMRKAVPDWPLLDTRLRHSGLSIQMIRELRDDYENGWKKWDGRPFSQEPLSATPNSLPNQNSNNFEAAEVSTAPKVKLTLKHGGQDMKKPAPRLAAGVRMNKVAEDNYDSTEEEETAARTAVKTRQKSGRGSGQKRAL